MSKTARLDELGIDGLCERVIGGDSYRQIADSLGVSPALVTTWVSADAERSARAREARVLSAQTWDEKAERAIIDADNALDVSKAKELAHHYRWRASKISPAYGDKVQHVGDGGGTIRSKLTVEFVGIAK